MKKNIFILLAAVSFGLFSCQNNDDDGNNYPSVDTGIMGIVKYGMGECETSEGGHPNDYQLYTGTLYFIAESELEIYGEDDFDELKANNLGAVIFNGNLSLELPTGTYVVMPEELYEHTEENTITIEEDEVLTKNFNFWKCTPN